MSKKIGFPRSLFYFLYFPFWNTFFTELGFEVVTSLPTTKYSLDLGVKEAVNDACMPIKLYHGHTAEIKDKVDVLFLPRMVSVRKLDKETFCPKFLGLPDMIRNSIDDLPPIIDEKVELSKGYFAQWKLSQRVAEKLGKTGWEVWRAYKKSRKVQREYIEDMAAGMEQQAAMDKAVSGKNKIEKTMLQKPIKLAILGYPYLIYDSFINVGLLEKLENMGVEPLTVEMVPPKRLEAQGKNLEKQLFWHFSNRTMRATYYYIKEKKVDGIVHATAFGCGPDAMVDKLMELEAKNNGRIPFLTLSLDEHTGEAGVMTRIEAFVDMLKIRRRADESIISNNG